MTAFTNFTFTAKLIIHLSEHHYFISTEHHYSITAEREVRVFKRNIVLSEELLQILKAHAAQW
jgi:hypothetical protein